MKKSIQNLFTPFSISGKLAKNRFQSRRKLTHTKTLFNSNMTSNTVNFQSENRTIDANQDYFTAFDIDLKNSEFYGSTESNPVFIFDSTIVGDDEIPELHTLKEQNRILAAHWGEIEDYELLNNLQFNENEILKDSEREYRPFLWLI